MRSVLHPAWRLYLLCLVSQSDQVTSLCSRPTRISPRVCWRRIGSQRSASRCDWRQHATTLRQKCSTGHGCCGSKPRANPQLDVCDIRHLVDVARAHGVQVAVDNTTATAYLQQPLKLGADYVVASDTKALTGHSDLVLGHVATADEERTAALREWRTQHGAIPGPMETWLAHRSLATLPLRLTRQCASAMQLAELLSVDSGVCAVYYPGMPDHPGHSVATRQMSSFGPVVSFDLGTRGRAEAFLRTLRIVREATSFGGVHSTAERRKGGAVMRSARVSFDSVLDARPGKIY